MVLDFEARLRRVFRRCGVMPPGDSPVTGPAPDTGICGQRNDTRDHHLQVVRVVSGGSYAHSFHVPALFVKDGSEPLKITGAPFGPGAPKHGTWKSNFSMLPSGVGIVYWHHSDLPEPNEVRMNKRRSPKAPSPKTKVMKARPTRTRRNASITDLAAARAERQMRKLGLLTDTNKAHRRSNGRRADRGHRTVGGTPETPPQTARRSAAGLRAGI